MVLIAFACELMTSVHHDVVLKCVVLIAFACELMTSVHHDVVLKCVV